MSESDDFDDNEEDDDDDDDLSDDEDLEYADNRCRAKRQKVGHRPKSTRDNKSSVHIQRKRGRTFSDEEESSEKDSEQDSDEDFSRKTRKSLQSRKKGGGRSTGYVSINSHSSELRTSGRTVRKVSYVESEESEKEDEERTAKSQKVGFNLQLLLFTLKQK